VHQFRETPAGFVIRVGRFDGPGRFFVPISPTLERQIAAARVEFRRFRRDVGIGGEVNCVPNEFEFSCAERTRNHLRLFTHGLNVLNIYICGGLLRLSELNPVTTPPSIARIPPCFVHIGLHRLHVRRGNPASPWHDRRRLQHVCRRKLERVCRCEVVAVATAANELQWQWQSSRDEKHVR